jgi:hypothetical protein
MKKCNRRSVPHGTFIVIIRYCKFITLKAFILFGIFSTHVKKPTCYFKLFEKCSLMKKIYKLSNQEMPHEADSFHRRSLPGARASDRCPPLPTS